MSKRFRYPAALSALAPRSSVIQFLLLLSWLPCRAQTFPQFCTASSGEWRSAHLTQICAAASDILINGSGGTPTSTGAPVPVVDIQVYFNTALTVRTAGNLAESLLLVDDPSPASQLPCLDDPLVCQWTGGASGANVYQGRILRSLRLPITMKPPLSGTRKLYMRMMDALGIDSGWSQFGTYQVP